MAVSPGANVTAALVKPALGTTDGVLKLNVPGTGTPAALVTEPPMSVEALNARPKTKEDAPGTTASSGVCLDTVTFAAAAAVV